MKHVCVWLIRFYQKFLSPLKGGPCCRFTPTCSAYAVEAFINRGFFVGFGLTVWRILRCNPFCRGGYDPVPPKRVPKYHRDREENDGAESLRDSDETPDTGKNE